MFKLIPDFAPGPLDLFRKRTSFNWKKLKVFLDTEDIIKYENELIKILENNPIYNVENLTTKSLDEQRKIAFMAACHQSTIPQMKLLNMLDNVKRFIATCRIMTVVTDASYIKNTVGNSLFVSSIMNMGTSRHEKFMDDAENGKILGCYCLTEIGHGSNARGMRTTATYDKNKKVFVINSPDFEAAKCWAGGLGQTAMYGTVYAQLVIDNTHYGLHAFVVPIRDPKTLLPFPGIEVGDMGPKIGLNGIDNGFIRFMNYEIPRENLLNKVADVTEDGRYVTPIKDPNKRHGAALGSLSAGRVNIAGMCDALGAKALTIAIRYAAVRKQFGPEKEEIPILEYQSHQFRLIPYLAALYVIRNFNTFFSEQFIHFSINNITGKGSPEMGIEIHGLSSASKPLAGWIMKEAIQESREACAGHGYLHAAGLGDVRNELDPNLTYEGENHVLIQQTINWLLKMAPQVLQGSKISSPLQSLDFLSNGLDILKNSRFTARGFDEVCHPESVIKTFQWLVLFLLKSTHDKVEEEIKSGENVFTAKNNSQVYFGKSLAIAFIQHYSLQIMLKKINEAEDLAIKRVLTRLFSLYGLWAIDKWHMATLYKGGFATGPSASVLIQNAVLQLCRDLKDDAVGLVDAIALPDCFLRSVLGASDGQVYKHLYESMTKNKYNMNRPPWWKDVVDYTEKNSKSKL
ncbi:peroxisomal acyl-coenzyme A oxidase 3-like isoform X2 [Diorhabda sublineata]|uniref:peroxisomal acyl-coenzyme A oxidase 3-like isoform X2 n=1 Tax=Diorhabda sublineata TaxID=1163346 RepID=UPI0024E0FDFA|nr:peroxisomal acyl-coenzyme A oxidase 3-like isoform X2 [Diorhabda sublineata]